MSDSSDVKRMDKQIIFQTLLKQFSPIAPKKLHEKLRENGVPICRDTLFRWANNLQKEGKLERKNRVWHYKPSTEQLPSRQLIPALRKIAGIVGSKYSVSGAEEYASPEDMKILVEMAEGYLREHSELRELFENYKQKNEEAGQRKMVFTDGLMKKLTKELGETVNTKKAMRLQNFVGGNLPSLICNHMLYGSPTHLYREGRKIWFGDNLVAKGDDVFSKIDGFVKRETADESNVTAMKQIQKIELDAFEAQRKLQPEIRNLIIRIKSENQ